jgi:hypothetical protein
MTLRAAACRSAKSGCIGTVTPDFSPIAVLVEMSFVDHPSDQTAQRRQQIYRPVTAYAAFVSTLMTLRVGNANGFSPFSGSSDSTSPVRWSRVESAIDRASAAEHGRRRKSGSNAAIYH